MAHTFTKIAIHAVFSTKDRKPYLQMPIRDRLIPYMGGIIRELGGSALIINGPADHVHLLFKTPATIALSDLMRTVKTNSSRWVHEQFPTERFFAWQSGYGAFSASESMLEKITQYIAKQEEHHRRVTFQEEFIDLLKRHGIQYDERYIWE